MEPELTLVEQVAHAFKMALPGIIVVATPIILVIVRSVTNKISHKADAQTRIHIQEAMLNITLQGIALSEQLATKYKRANEGDKMDSDFKLEIAVKYVLDEMHRINLPELSVGKVEERVESYLGVGALSTMHHGGEENALYED